MIPVMVPLRAGWGRPVGGDIEYVLLTPDGWVGHDPR
jgi:hypothetical protein